MDRVELIIYKNNQSGNTPTSYRAVVNKWKFQDAMMGEQYITFTITSEKPIDWAVGDYCVWRGETYTLNYVPSVTQKARTGERQDAYTYENVKFESHQEELTRCLMLDITASTGEYVAAFGTNYTGSSKFQLFCGEVVSGEPTHATPAVCVLAAKMQANLDRMYGGANAWKIFVDTTTTIVNATGNTVLVTHTDDKVLSFDNNTVAQALTEVHNTFDLDYCIRGRSIYIGYNMANLTGDDDIIENPSRNDNETFSFGYGKGYPTHEDMNHGLFQIKRIANSQQKIVTRLRALGSTKNMPYRYYNKKYGLSQSLFPTNLQLPDTFLPMGEPSDAAGADTKCGKNKLRDVNLRKVKGDTNDAYIDKNDDAAACAEGIREDSARWDGSNGDLPEIYPTIEEATYGELRGAGVEDQDGNTGNGSFPGYSADERIDKLLAVGYKDGDTLVDDANKGDGILPESGISSSGIARSCSIGDTHLTYGRNNQFTYNGNYFAGKEHTLFTIQGVMPGLYAMSPAIGSSFFGFSLSCYRDGCSADVGFQIVIKQKSQQTGEVTTLGTYTSELESIQRSDGIKEKALPELPDVVNGENAQVNEIRVTAMSDITVTFKMVMRNIIMPSGFTDDFSISYRVGNSRRGSGNNYEPEYTWFPVDDSDTIIDRFHVFVQDMGFDFEACWSNDTPMLVMKSGRCVGREFEILQDVQKVTHDGKKGYMLTLKRAEDSSLNTYYPSQTDPIAAEDTFVLLGIQMPDAYVKMAEVRLLKAATQYLADNCETKFTYQPSIDDIYLQRNYDNMVKAGTPSKSIFWRLYAGLKFTFRGVPSSVEVPAPVADITIEKVTISMGEGLTPKVELTLNDDVQQGTIQKLTTSVDRIYNGSIFASGSGNGVTGAMSAALLSLLQSEGEKLFLSKTHDDTAEGKITFNDVVTHNETLKARKGVKVGNFQSRFLGSGALIDEHGNAEFESIYSRNFISTPEFRFNRITVTEGENWNTNGFGTIQDVEIINSTTGYITLKLEENDYSSLETGDICRGIYNDIANQYETASLDDDSSLYAGVGEPDGYGFSSKEGYFTSYFWIRSFVVNRKGECKFLYELRNSGTPHPCSFMKFAQYGSFTNANRRSSSYSTSIGHYYEMVLDGVNTWKIKSSNVVFRKGWLGDMTVTLKNGKEATLQGYGLYVQDNVYFGNAIVEIDPETLSDIEESLKQYDINFSSYVDVITVDDVGNCIGGLWTVSGANNEYRNYKIHSAITVRKNGNLLTIAADDAYAGTGTYKIYAHPRGCSCVIENSTIYITGIDHIKDGVPGSADDVNFDYAAMRAMESCSVDLIIDCEGNTVPKSFPIRIKHDSQPYVGADISNEFSAVSWNTHTQAYVGLPITFDMKMWHNNEILDIASAADISLTTSTTGVTLVNGTAPSTPASSSIYYTKSVATIVKNQGTANEYSYKVARITITAMGVDVPLVTEINVTTTAVYSGVSYERTLVHTINKSTDTNVYQLHPSVGEVSVVYNANKEKVVSTDKVYTSVRCDSSDDKHYTVATSDYAKHGLFITYQTFTLNASNQEVASAEGAYNTLYGVTVSNTYTRIRFKLYKLVDTTLSTLVALLDSTNVIEVLDTEDVPVVLDGLDGDNSIAVHLDNQNDSVMCLEDGTVIASTLPTAKARLMDGDETIGRSVLGTTLPANKQTLGNWTLTCHGCTAEFVGWVTDSDSNDWVSLRVTGVSDDVASVDVQCQYTKHGVTVTYLSILSVKKIYGLDKYEIITDPVSIAYDPNSDLHTPTSVNVYVYLTTQEEDRHLMTSLPSHSSATDGDVRLQYTVDNGSHWYDLTGYNSGVAITRNNHYYSITSGAVLLRVQKYVAGESGGEWIILDEEGVEITRNGQDGKGVEYIFFAVSDWDGVEAHKPPILDVAADRQVDNYCPYTDAGHTDQWTDEPTGVSLNHKYEFYAQRKKVNGVWQAFSDVKVWDHFPIDGETPYMIDLSNEQSFVNCDENGNVLSGATYETTRLMLFKGSSYAFTDFNILVTPTNISCNGSTNSFYLTESQKSTAQSNGYFVLTPSAITSNTAQISIQAQLKTNTSIVLTTTYKINKNIAGGIGLDAVMYSLIPSLNVVHKDGNGNFIDTVLDLAVKKIVGTSVSTIDTVAGWDAEGFVLKYSRGSSSTQNTLGSFTNLSTSTLFATSTRITIYLYNDSNVLLDKESINVVCDGEDGEDGADAHEVNPNILLRTIFNNGINFVKEAWSGNYTYISIDTAADTVIEGRKSVRINPYGLSSSNYIDFSQDVYSRIKPNTWYTLSFYYFATAQFSTFIYDGDNTSGIIDQSAGFYVDGTLVNGIGIDGHHSWPSDWNGLRHTLVFKTKSSFGTSEALIIFRTYGGSQLAICMPKLELGDAATAYMANESDLPGAIYYLTSDINSITRDKNGNYIGSARPTITGWKRIGSTVTRLADIVDSSTGVIAEGFVINAYEMNGDTVEYTNSSSENNTPGTLVCQTPYSYVDRFEVELVKGGKTYATKSIPIITEHEGQAGADGVYPRDRGLFKSGTTYYYKKEGNMYVRDMVRYEIGGIMYGFLVKDTTVGSTGVTAAPTSASGDSNWESSGMFETVIANTVFGTNANIGGFMASSDRLRSSSILYRIRYKGTYQSNTYYSYTTSGSQSDNIAVRDMVKYNNEYYVILHQGSWTNNNGQSASGNYVPPTGTYYAPSSTEYWRKATKKEIEAVTYDSNGNELTGGTLEMPMFELNGSNGTMRVTQREETSWSVNENGVQTVGMENGQRVEITPLEKKISIFDNNNKQVAQFDGDKVSTIDDLFGNSSGSLGGTDGYTGNHSETSPSSNWHSGYKEGFVELGQFSSINGMITVVATGTLRAQGSSHYSNSFCDGDPAAILVGGVPSPVQYGNSYLFKNHVIARLVVGYYSNGVFNVETVLDETSALGVYETKTINVSKNVYGVSVRTYYLAIQYKIGLYYDSSKNWGNVSWSGIKVTYAGGSYISRVFANGFVYGLNGANFMSAVAETINGSTHMHVKAMSGGGLYGFEVAKDGLYVWISGTKYKVTVSGTNAVLTSQ